MTIYDIAKALDISYGTVSMALSGNKKIAEKTRVRVQEFATQHGFTPNKGARNLRLQKSSLVAVIVVDIASDFWAGVVSAIEETLGGAYNLIICNSCGSVEKEQKIIASLVALRIGGVIVQPADTRHIDHLSELNRAGVPTVLFECTGNDELSFVKGNDYVAARRAVEELTIRGHQRIALLSNSQPQITGPVDREKGFLDAAAAAGISELCHVSNLQHPSITRLDEVFTDRVRDFSAVVCIDDCFVIPLLKILRREKLDCPNDISLLCWRNRVVLDMMMPAVSHFDIPVKKMGRIAAEFIMQRQSGQSFVLQEFIDEPLIIGESITQISKADGAVTGANSRG